MKLHLPKWSNMCGFSSLSWFRRQLLCGVNNHKPSPSHHHFCSRYKPFPVMGGLSHWIYPHYFLFMVILPLYYRWAIGGSPPCRWYPSGIDGFLHDFNGKSPKSKSRWSGWCLGFEPLWERLEWTSIGMMSYSQYFCGKIKLMATSHHQPVIAGKISTSGILREQTLELLISTRGKAPRHDPRENPLIEGDPRMPTKHIHKSSGWWLGHPSEKYESQLRWWNSQDFWENNMSTKPPTSKLYTQCNQPFHKPWSICENQEFPLDSTNPPEHLWIPTKSPWIIPMTLIKHGNPKSQVVDDVPIQTAISKELPS